jgi:hypothetical protein
MKKLFTIVIALLSTWSFASAQLNFKETFSDNAANSAVENIAQPNFTVQGDWTVSCKSGEKDGTSPLVKTGALSYTNYVASGEGKSLAINASDQGTTGLTTANKRNTIIRFTTDALAIEAVTYAAFLVDLTDYTATTTGSEICSFFKQGSSYSSENTGTSSTMRGRIVVTEGSSADKVTFAMRKNSTTGSATNEYNKNATFLIVAKYTNNSTSSSGVADVFEFFVNPDLSKTEAENTKIAAGGNANDGGADLRHFAFRQMGETNFKVSGLIFTDSWDNLKSGSSAVNNANTDAEIEKVEIYSIMGQLITTLTSEDLEAVNLKGGQYIAKSYYKDGTVNSKKIIKK